MLNFGATPFDLRLIAFRIPIRVHPSFWIVMTLFGWNPHNPQETFIWVMCAFISVLIHELGHAFTAESFGWPTKIVLYGMGGVAVSLRTRNNTPWRSIAVSLMGPGAGFLFYGLLVGIEGLLFRFHIKMDFYVWEMFFFLNCFNLYWGLFNLLPILPLDGGHIFQSLCEVVRLRDPVGASLKVSIVVGGAAAYYFFHYLDLRFAGIMMLLLCVQSFVGLTSRR